MSSACRISRGSEEKLNLGRLDIVRDWGWAPEYIEAMWQMLQVETPGDFVIATGYSATLEEFVARAFDNVKLDWQDFIVSDPAFFRPSDIAYSAADPSKAARVLNWSASTTLPQLVDRLMCAELRKCGS